MGLLHPRSQDDLQREHQVGQARSRRGREADAYGAVRHPRQEDSQRNQLREARAQCGLQRAAGREPVKEIRRLDHLDELESQSLYILREARAKIPRLAILWSIGKHSTVLLWLTRKAFFGHIPYPLIHIDTSYKIPEMIQYRDRLARELDRKSTRLNSSHSQISYAVFCLKKKNKHNHDQQHI